MNLHPGLDTGVGKYLHSTALGEVGADVVSMPYLQPLNTTLTSTMLFRLVTEMIKLILSQHPPLIVHRRSHHRNASKSMTLLCLGVGSFRWSISDSLSNRCSYCGRIQRTRLIYLSSSYKEDVWSLFRRSRDGVKGRGRIRTGHRHL